MQSEANGYTWVNIGSNSGLFAFDWTMVGERGLNLAGSPQSLRRGAGKVKARRAEIASGAHVLIPISPFSSIVPETYDQRETLESHPLLSFDGTPDEQTMADSADSLDGDWKHQFGIRDYADPMSDTNRKSYAGGVTHLMGFLDWCLEEGLKPVIVLPPASARLRRLFPDSFMQEYVIGFVRDAADGSGVKFLDYWADEVFQEERFFATSFFLNKTGRRLFTAKVMADCLRQTKGCNA